jgi:GntR family transcriptional regulator
MDLKIDPNSHVPIYLQNVEGIRSAVALGVVRPGEALPSLRSLGIELRVNPNTVQRAFEELERAGLIESRRGVGMYVAQRGLSPARGPDEAAVVEAFRRGIEVGRSAEIPPRRLRQLFDQAMGFARRGAGGGK